MIDGEFRVMTRDAQLEAAQAAILHAQDATRLLKERVNMLTADNDRLSAENRKMEREIKRLRKAADEDEPIDISPWEKLMKQRTDVEDTRESTGLLENE